MQKPAPTTRAALFIVIGLLLLLAPGGVAQAAGPGERPDGLEHAAARSANRATTGDDPAGQAPAPVKAAAGQAYTVQPGDTLWEIATRQGVSVGALLAANHLDQHAVLQPGQNILLPGVTAAAGPAASPPAQTANYTIQPGDTFWEIASSHNLTLDALLAANHLSARAVMQPGQTIVLPVEEKAAPAGQAAPPAEQAAAPAGDKAPPAAEKAAPPKQAAAPAEEKAAPAKQAAAPAEHTALPAEHAASPADKEAAPADKTPQAEQKSAPAAKMAPAKDKPAAAEKATATEQAPSPDNATGPAATDRGAPAGAAAKGFNYTIQAGDTLWDIAATHDLTVDDLLAANHLDQQAVLQPGQTIMVPADQTAAAGASPAPADQPAKGYTYTIQPSDTLWDIATRHGLAVDTLLAANNLSAQAVLHPGQAILVPAQPVAAVRKAAPAPAAAAAPAPAPATAPAPAGLPSQMAEWPAALLGLINEQRAARNLPALAWSAELAAAAQAHADDCSRRGFGSHVGSDGARLAARLLRAGFAAKAASENWANTMGVTATFSMWWNEPPGADPHRRNILDPAYREIGIGLADARWGYYFIADFGRR